ncbi:sugar transferase [Spongiactinospora sp. TRM90649]|uniref:sugar transferase n=1 Tax=Spongiactinospora sp. TRM90649 TaxID=3031114 RepID=UPI0023F93E01|nr:sugar transferase [Spongiactinospora sp. TRM90649]MDF5754999.1 sugar transferase [Spongiactinospora sp. TRM90649]
MRVGVEERSVALLDDVVRTAPSIWTRSYVRILLAGDLACAVIACEIVIGTRLWLGAYVPGTEALLGLTLALAWPAAMALGGAYRKRLHGEGSEEFRVVFNGGLALTAAVAIGAYATQTNIARSFVMAMFPLALVLTLFFRYRMRKRLHRLRKQGDYVRQMVAVGHREAVLDLVMQFRRQPHHGMQIVAACLPEGQAETGMDVDGVRVLGDFGNVAEAVARAEADSVAILACPELDGAALRRLAWSLEDARTELYVAPALMDVAGPRISIRPMAGMPLLHLEHPEFDGARRIVKTVFDRVVAGTVLTLLALPMLAIAVIIRATSNGPALFRQGRVGKDGQEFMVFKFRTMVVNAEARKLDLLGDNEFDGVLFKMRKDPRITRVGGFLRRYSLDELPQLLNVIRGEMSLVGPRPPLPDEVRKYGEDVRRRLVVKPGMTGLWQVSGRSDLTWEESVRLDLRYVENWSLVLDLQILWKTWAAVISGEGAY